ncbi:cyclic nucleotide-binding domain-containing protein [Burkholderia guangdongensis]|uniref:cyclic nucleotide-binding domain-containing protein n=1 Tax=Burkholderia guangdongensis TaxID=1792500 RepID=UPI0015CDA8DC
MERFARVKTYEPGAIVCMQGDMQSPLMLVLSGQLRACSISPDGREIQVGTADAGTCAGEAPIITNTPSPVHILATDRCVVALLSREHARQVFADPEVMRAINLRLAEKLTHLVRSTSDQGVQRAASRISAIIADALDDNGGDCTVALKLPNQSLIAARARVSRETVSRELATLQRRGIIMKEGRCIFVRDPATLRSTLN